MGRPSRLPDGWEQGTATLGLGDPVPDLRRAFPDPGPLVWKDPRLCLLYPYWRQLLPTPLAAVMVWRSPSGVADSLHRRDGMDPILGLALWERYNRQGLTDLDGVDTYLIHYERLLAEPDRTVESLASWLGSLEQFAGLAPGTKVAEAVATLTGTERPGTPLLAEPDGPDLLDGQRQLVEYLTANHGGQRPLRTPELGEDSPWTTAIIRARREFRSRELDDAERVFESRLAGVRAVSDYWERTVGAMTDSTSWKATRPLRSVTARLQRGRPTDARPHPLPSAPEGGQPSP